MGLTVVWHNILTKGLELVIKKLSGVITLFNASWDITRHYFVLLELRAKSVGIRLLLGKHLESLMFVIIVQLKVWEFVSIELPKGVKKEGSVNIEWLSASLKRPIFHLLLHILRIHIVQKQVLFLIGSPSTLISCKNWLNRAIFCSEDIGDLAFLHFVYFGRINNV